MAFLYTYGFILNTHYDSELTTAFKKIANGTVFERNDNFIERWFSRIHKIITKCIEQNQLQASAATDEVLTQGLNFKNWLRSTSEFEKFKREFKWITVSDYPL
jgi:hypothetical protein